MVDSIKITPPDWTKPDPVFTASARGLTATGGSEELARVRLILMVAEGALKKNGW